MERSAAKPQLTLASKKTEVIQSFNNELELMSRQQEMSVKNVETLSTSSAGN